jgi:hypothetical protein
MQFAHSTSDWVAVPACGAVVVDPVLLLLVLALFPKLATCGGFGEPPPHAASPMATAVTRMASAPDRPNVLGLWHRPCARDALPSIVSDRSSLPPCICFLSSVDGLLKQLYEMQGHRPVTVVTWL